MLDVIRASRRRCPSYGPMFVGRGGGGMGFIELFGTVRTVEFVTLTGDGNQGNSQEQNGGKFHRAAS
jgi:hypothetical protein